MAVRNVILVVLLVVNVAVCRPRDSTAVHEKDPIVQDAESQFAAKAETSTLAHAQDHPVIITGRISCPHEEAEEDTVCSEHCLPKGYAYGICVNKTCSCI